MILARRERHRHRARFWLGMLATISAGAVYFYLIR